MADTIQGLDDEYAWVKKGWKRHFDGSWVDPDGRGPYRLDHKAWVMVPDFDATPRDLSGPVPSTYSGVGSKRTLSSAATPANAPPEAAVPAAAPRATMLAIREDAPALDTDTMRRLIASRMALEVIAEITEDHMGLGILYDILPGIGEEPSADLANLLSAQSGLDVVTHVESVELVDLEVGDASRKAWRAHVVARDRWGREADAVVFEPAEQTVAWVKGEKYTRRDGKDVDVSRLNEPKSAITKARRNAQIKLLGYPKSILVPLIKKVMKEHAAGRS